MNYYFPNTFITMTTLPLPTVILALEATFFPGSELRLYDVAAGTTAAKFQDDWLAAAPSAKGGEYDNFVVAEKGEITLDTGVKAPYHIQTGTRMGYTTKGKCVFLVSGTKGFWLSGYDYVPTFSDSLPIIDQILKTLHLVK